VFVDYLEGCLVKLNIFVRSFPNWRAREILRVAMLFVPELLTLVFTPCLWLPLEAPIS